MSTVTLSHEIAQRRSWLERATAALIVAHLGMVALHLMGRVVPAVPPTGAPDSIEPALHIASYVHWSAWHLTAAAALTVARVTRSPRTCSIASSLSFWLWVVWGTLVTLWSLWAVPPTSLVAPLLIAVFAVPSAYVVSGAWIEREE